MKIESGFYDTEIIKTFPISVNSILSASYSYTNGGNNWPFASLCLKDINDINITYWYFINELDYKNMGAYLESTFFLFLIGI